MHFKTLVTNSIQKINLIYLIHTKVESVNFIT